MPNLVLIAAGHLVGDVPAAARGGLDSAAGHRLIGALAVTGAAYAAALLLGPVQSALSSVVKWRIIYRTQDRLIAAAGRPQRADATAVAQALPEGLATPLGRSFTGGQELSGGQWQRLALARGMMRDAPLLLVLDEPTASLDAITEAALFERYLAARELASRTGAITLLVSHRFSTVRMADLIVVLDQGRIAASGDHAALLRAGGLYAELYEMQARSDR